MIELADMTLKQANKEKRLHHSGEIMDDFFKFIYIYTYIYIYIYKEKFQMLAYYVTLSKIILFCIL